MNVHETHELIDRHYEKPALKQYELTDCDIKYKFKGMLTPKQIQKAGEFKAKEDAKLKAEYDAECERLKVVHATVDRVSAYPKEISYLFCNTIDWAIIDTIRRHERFVEAAEKFKARFGETGYSFFSSVAGNMTKESRSWMNGRYRTTKEMIPLTDEWWEKLVESSRRNFHKNETTGEYEYEYPLKEFDDCWKVYADECRNLKELRDDDAMSACGNYALKDTIQRIAATLDRVMTDISDAFAGGIPESCETDPHWGTGGKFNAVLRKGNERVSFCSFSAGGHHIQRYHFRAKVTKLADKA